jgi:hypothetical protein
MAIPKVAPDEEFRAVTVKDGFYADRYLISNYGRVVSLWYFGVKGRTGLMSPSNDGGGYPVVKLIKHKKQHSTKVHILVAGAFIGPRPPRHDINHINGIKTDARATNLEYCTRKENARHAVQNELFAVGERIARSRLTAEQVRSIRRKHSSGMRQKELAEEYGLLQNHVCKIVNRKLWVHLDD